MTAGALHAVGLAALGGAGANSPATMATIGHPNSL